MGLKICSLASGSRGNCIYVGSDTTSILVDAGISCKRIRDGLKVLGANTDNLSLIITHSHSDHISNLKMIAKLFSPVIYVHYLTYPQIASLLPGYLKLKEFDGDFYLGDITVSPFRISHDVPCVGFGFYSGGKKISLATDIGVVTKDNLRHLEGSDVVFIESNHDENMLRANPHYATSLKRRILSDRGHLSNSACAEAAVACIKSGTKSILLGHLSKENNTPELAYRVTRDKMDAEGLSAMLSVTSQDKMSELIEVS